MKNLTMLQAVNSTATMTVLSFVFGKMTLGGSAVGTFPTLKAHTLVHTQLVLLQAVARLECEFALGAWVRSHPSVVHEVPANNL